MTVSFSLCSVHEGLPWVFPSTMARPNSPCSLNTLCLCTLIPGGTFPFPPSFPCSFSRLRLVLLLLKSHLLSFVSYLVLAFMGALTPLCGDGCCHTGNRWGPQPSQASPTMLTAKLFLFSKYGLVHKLRGNIIHLLHAYLCCGAVWSAPLVSHLAFPWRQERMCVWGGRADCAATPPKPERSAPEVRIPSNLCSCERGC